MNHPPRKVHFPREMTLKEKWIGDLRMDGVGSVTGNRLFYLRVRGFGGSSRNKIRLTLTCVDQCQTQQQLWSEELNFRNLTHLFRAVELKRSGLSPEEQCHVLIVYSALVTAAEAGSRSFFSFTAMITVCTPTVSILAISVSLLCHRLIISINERKIIVINR